MKNYPLHIKNNLRSVIRDMAKHPEDFCRSPGKDFTRDRKLPFEKLLTLLVKMGGHSLRDEMLDCLILRNRRHQYPLLSSNGASCCRKLWNTCSLRLQTDVTSQSCTKDTACWQWMVQTCNLPQILTIHYPIFPVSMVRNHTVSCI